MAIYESISNSELAELLGATIISEEALVEAESGGDFDEIPHNKYEVRIDKLQIKKSRKGAPMLHVQFRILEGEFTNHCLFYYQVLNNAVGLRIALDFLRSFDSGVTLDRAEVFTDKQFDLRKLNAKLQEIARAIDSKGLEYALSYTESKSNSDYSDFKIDEVFES